MLKSQSFDEDTFCQILPCHVEKNYNVDREETQKQLSIRDVKNYSDKVKKYYELFSLLEPSKINVLYYKSILNLETNETILNNLKSFKPNKGYSKAPKYDIFNTITGRAVNTGEYSKILTLPSRCRNIFESRWGKNGKIVNIDFKTLEPRLARKFNKKSTSNDLYKELSDILEYNVDRSIIKKAVISILYGSSTQLKELSEERSNKVLNKIKDYFEIEKLIKIADNLSEHGYRENYFGRPIHNLNETNNNKIINNYIQSSAVDIALTYFYELSSSVNKDLCKPLFIIHDAIVFDVHMEYFEELNKKVKLGYNCPELGYFPLEITNLFEENKNV
jgi:ribosomal protein S13